MGISQKESLKDWLKYWMKFLLVVFLILGYATYYMVFHTPKNSLELYQSIATADDFEEATKLMSEGFEGNFKEEDFEFISKSNASPNRVGQFAIFEYDEKTFVVMTTAGTNKLEILAVDDLPKDLRDYFLQLGP
ncbi:hypothetical protein AV656_11805 [Bhargavaea cecembensis]|uniref:Uncharacterized protein n=1 Tax=Bhargavaea cecembensis TaxID=394098 RepID=A0A165GQ53_9BACL|nr:hypothetical protein [Bhargavaea cecembensis]KZE37249.1 hypothetical protein AV656_11805 [Bhargavaea cecembensis]